MIAEVRPRSQWEAVDLGWVLARTRYGALLRTWVLMVWPVWALILIGFREQPVLGLAVIWWLKPLAERVPLLILSREMFGERMSLGQLFRQWPRVWFGGLFHYLIATRLSPSRHVELPVRELEELRGVKLRQRSARIASQCGSHPWLMQLAHLALLHGLALSILLFVLAMIPERFAPNWELLFDHGFGEDGVAIWCVWVWTGLYLLALTLVSPLCVAAGFGLYLNSRTKLEGWDIEIAFRKLAGRMAAAGGGLAPLLIVLSGMGIHDAVAATASAEWEAGREIAEILAKPEFKIYTRTEYRPVAPEKMPEEWHPPDWFHWEGWFPGFSVGLNGVTVAQGLMWLLVALAVGIVLVLLVKWMATWRGTGLRADPRKPAVTTVMGMNVRQDSLPRDILAAVRKLLEAGQFEAGMALLYRGALSWLIHQEHVPIQESDTERDCVNRVRTLDAGGAPYFEDLTRVWSAAAYGSRRAGREEIERLLENWPYHRKRKEAG
jgi:hypothetical protein